MLSMIVKNTHGTNALKYSVDGSTVETPDDATDEHWAPITETGRITDISNIIFTAGSKDLLEFDSIDLSYIRIRAVNNVLLTNSSIAIYARGVRRPQ